MCGHKPLLLVLRSVHLAGNCHSASVARRMTEIKLEMLCQLSHWGDSVISVIFWNDHQDFVCSFLCMHRRVVSPMYWPISIRTVGSLDCAVSEFKF
jgi:hypothetical protein